MMNDPTHIPVMMHEVLAALHPRDGGVYVDGTFGRGGYSRALLQAAQTQVIGIDRDPEAIAVGEQLAQQFAPRLKILHGTFGVMDQLLTGAQIGAVDGVALDLGVSSPQFDQASRGFSFQQDGPLDMRMSLSGQSAADIVNSSSESDLADIIYNYGEERFSRRVARRIVEARANAKITRTYELADLVRKAVPRSADGIDPATRTFQALRVAVNDELGELQRGLAAAEKLLKPQGILAVVSFHSLEDRCVKEFFRTRSGAAARGSRHAPANDQDSGAATFRLHNKKPLLPSATDISNNPRARSAKLRVAERTDAPARMENAA